MKPQIKGNIGFEKKEAPKKEILKKEETMFQVDATGKAIPEQYPIFLYDRMIDRELIEESFLLLETIRKQKAILLSIKLCSRIGLMQKKILKLFTGLKRE